MRVSGRVSVIVPCYNGAVHLREALESALAQTHEDTEILVVDDGSTDGTQEIVEAVVRVLLTSGRLAVQTDHAEYFEQIKQVTRARTELAEIPFDDPAFGTVGERTETNFEVKYLRAGRPIYRLAFRRT